FFFFQAEDGIRYFHVTGVQTCALPILSSTSPMVSTPGARDCGWMQNGGQGREVFAKASLTTASLSWLRLISTSLPLCLTVTLMKIGRASCRERVELWGVVGGI